MCVHVHKTFFIHNKDPKNRFSKCKLGLCCIIFVGQIALNEFLHTRGDDIRKACELENSKTSKKRSHIDLMESTRTRRERERE